MPCYLITTATNDPLICTKLTIGTLLTSIVIVRGRVIVFNFEIWKNWPPAAKADALVKKANCFVISEEKS